LGVPRKKRFRIFARDGYRCRYCGYDMTLHFPYPHLRVLTVDHVLPKGKGGTERFDNLVTACYSCNTRKGNRPVAEFLRELYDTGTPPPGEEHRLRWRVVRVRLIQQALAADAHLGAESARVY